MDDDSIVIDVRLSEKEISAAADRIARKLKAALGPLFGGGPGAGNDPITPRLRDQEAAALRLAQAQARLAQANGNLSQAQRILSDALSKTTKETATQISAQIQLTRVNQQAERSTQQHAVAVTGLTTAFRTLAGVGVVALFQQFGRAAVDAAFSVDKQINSLKALTGSAEAAQRRFKELFNLAQQTPGLTTNLAATLDAQLRIFRVSEQTINRLLPVVGRLNAISPLGDPRQFVNNLTQLISQNFERQDLKELVGQSPIAGQLIAQIFNVDNPTNAEAIRKAAKRMGVTTVERLAEELIGAANNNAALRNATESLAGQFEKMQERINLALAPIGEAIIKTVLPQMEKFIELLEKHGPNVAKLLEQMGDEIERSANRMGFLAESTDRFIQLITGLESKTGLIGFLNRVSEVLNPVVFGIDVIQREARRIEGFIRGIDPNLPPPPPPGRTIVSGSVLDEANPLFYGGGRGGAVIVNTKGQALDSNGNVIRRPTGAGGGRGITASQREAARERVARNVSRINIEALERNTEARLNGANEATAELIKSYNKEIKAREKYVEALENLGAATTSMLNRGFSDLIRSGRREFNNANSDSGRAYNLQLQGIDELVNRGAINPSEAEALRRQAALQRAGALNSNLAGPNAKFIDRDDIQNLRDEADQMTRLGTAISDAERFMRGFNSATLSVADAWDRFGQSVGQALTNTRDLLNGLKQSILGLFNDLLGSSLQNVVRQALGPLAGIFGGGGRQAAVAGAAGAAGNFFSAPAAAASGGSGGTLSLSNILRGVGGGGGDGISVPPSVSSGIGTLPIFRGNFPVNVPIANASGGVLASAAAKPGFFSSLGTSLASAAPFLGLSLGGSLGGQSALGQIAGSAGGFLAGGAVAASLTKGVFSAGAKAFLTNPFTIAIGAGLLVGSFFLGRAQQRRKDEEASGQFLTQAMQGIQQLASGVASGQVDVSQARQVFDSQILGPFKQQISGLQTKSVRESRLTNQVRDLEGMYKALVEPAITNQIQQRRDAARFSAIDSRLVPQFAAGGFVPGIDRGRDSVLAFMRPGELVLNQTQQSAVRSMGGSDIFDRAGVPRQPIYTNGTQAMAGGGYAQATPMRISLYVQHGMSRSDAREIVAVAVDDRTGQRILVDAYEEEMSRRSG